MKLGATTKFILVCYKYRVTLTDLLSLTLLNSVFQVLYKNFSLLRFVCIQLFFSWICFHRKKIKVQVTNVLMVQGGPERLIFFHSALTNLLVFLFSLPAPSSLQFCCSIYCGFYTTPYLSPSLNYFFTTL